MSQRGLAEYLSDSRQFKGGLGPMHGYGVGQRIQQLAEHMLRIEEGTLYPALYRIEQKGWIESEWGLSENNRRARYPHLFAQSSPQ